MKITKEYNIEVYLLGRAQHRLEVTKGKSGYAGAIVKRSWPHQDLYLYLTSNGPSWTDREWFPKRADLDSVIGMLTEIQLKALFKDRGISC